MRSMRRELIANRALARHATWTALAAVSLDAAYSVTFWLVLGRDERRNGRYPELKYFALVGQLAVETAAIVHLVSKLREMPADNATVTELRAA